MICFYGVCSSRLSCNSRGSGMLSDRCCSCCSSCHALNACKHIRLDDESGCDISTCKFIPPLSEPKPDKKCKPALAKHFTPERSMIHTNFSLYIKRWRFTLRAPAEMSTFREALIQSRSGSRNLDSAALDRVRNPNYSILRWHFFCSQESELFGHFCRLCPGSDLCLTWELWVSAFWTQLSHPMYELCTFTLYMAANRTMRSTDITQASGKKDWR